MTGPFGVPIRTEISGPTFIKLERFASAHHTTVARVVAELVERSVAGKPRRRKSRSHIPAEVRARVLELKAAGTPQMAIAEEVGYSQATISRIVRGIG